MVTAKIVQRLSLFCLCLILTLCMAGSRSPAAMVTGVPYSGRWWGSEASQKIRSQGWRYWSARNWSAAEQLYQQGYQEALRRHDMAAAERYLSSVAGCRFAQFRYRDALDLYLQARAMARTRGDREELSAIAFNLSSLYLQVWDFDSALQAAEEGRATISALANPYYKAYLLLQLGRLHAAIGDGTAEALFEEAIEAARAQGDVAQEARGWDLLGEERLKQGYSPGAERAVSEAFRLRRLYDRPSLAFSYARLGAVKLAQGDWAAADRFTERALEASAGGGTAFPEYLLRHQRGRIRLARGQPEAALQDFKDAMDLASKWRLNVLPAVSSLAGVNTELESRVFDSFIETGAGRALRTRSSRWAVETFQAVESNRAASLRESLALADTWRKKLSPRYWELRAELRAEEARPRPAGARSRPRADQLRLKLTEMEAQVGSEFSVNKAVNNGENFLGQTSLIHFQAGLSDSELFLSFHLGDAESFLWAVTRESLTLHRLAPAKWLRAEVGEFREAVRAGRQNAAMLGERLYTGLFGGLTRRQREKGSWLLSLDDALFGLPFAALVTEQKGGRVRYLVEGHSLQVVPGALSLNAKSQRRERNEWWLGVGDPIYNAADPRWRGAIRRGFFDLFVRADPGEGLGQFGRLVASGAELDTSARNWSTEPGTAVLLRGAEARRDRFLHLAAGAPAVIHLATHVLTPPGERGQAFIVFGLGSGGGAEFITTSDVAMLRVPRALVIMTGCETGLGEVRAGTGLLGLTRAWQMAGASAVVATEWPEKDSKGEIFASFYRHLRNASAAEALRRSQVEMVRSGTWRAAPGYWASYQVTGGAR